MWRLNKQIGCDDLVVEGNHSKISVGCLLLRALLATGDYVCLNNSSKCKGGPFTRYEPSSPKGVTKMSCLDYIIVSRSLVPYVESIVIDSQKEFGPIRHLTIFQ